MVEIAIITKRYFSSLFDRPVRFFLKPFSSYVFHSNKTIFTKKNRNSTEQALVLPLLVRVERAALLQYVEEHAGIDPATTGTGGEAKGPAGQALEQSMAQVSLAR